MDRKPELYDKVVFWTQVGIITILWAMISGGVMMLTTPKWTGLHWYMWTFTGPGAGFLIGYGLKKR